MIEWGISAQSHDSALSVIKDNSLVWAGHNERYSKVKNDADLSQWLIDEASEWGQPDAIHWYENPKIKKRRQARAGQYNLLRKISPSAYLANFGIRDIPITYAMHHRSHAAGGFYTSGWESADVLVIDAIGEWQTLSAWRADKSNLTEIFSQDYPHSIGIWFSAMTQRIGLKPNEHEYILMGMAALGDPGKYRKEIEQDFFKQMPSATNPNVQFKQNLHRGCQNWRPDLNSVQDVADIAAATQALYEDVFINLLKWLKHNGTGDRLVLSGGCVLNCVANRLAFNYYDHVWIMPNPGDAGSSLGAILANNPRQIDFTHAYLGHNIPGEYPIRDVINDLQQTGMSAVASGRAEWGPRALGHRSILGDPRLPDIKDKINTIKHREHFRPFSPMILEEHIADYFQIPRLDFKSPYMQFTLPCLKPDQFPGIVHFDGSSRVQTVGKESGSVRTLLEEWYALTGCPMLLNTSLNIKGQPLVNTKRDAHRWTQTYGITVRTPK